LDGGELASKLRQRRTSSEEKLRGILERRVEKNNNQKKKICEGERATIILNVGKEKKKQEIEGGILRRQEAQKGEICEKRGKKKRNQVV